MAYYQIMGYNKHGDKVKSVAFPFVSWMINEDAQMLKDQIEVMFKSGGGVQEVLIQERGPLDMEDDFHIDKNGQVYSDE